MNFLECCLCGKVFAHDPFHPFCPVCGEPGFVHYENKTAGRVFHQGAKTSLEKYLEFLPLTEVDPAWSLGEGKTPLLRLPDVQKNTGIFAVFAKNEAQNPTGSFKDRGTAVMIQKVVQSGFSRIGTVSTGNMAGSTAAYGARASLQTVVLLKEGTPAATLRTISAFGPAMVRIKGDYGGLFRHSYEIGRKSGVYFANSTDPFRVEGYKCTVFEIYEELGGVVPDYLFVPVSSGGHIIGLMRAFEDLIRDRKTDKFPVFVGVQAKGCAPLAGAFEKQAISFSQVEEPRTIAHAISNPSPPAGNTVLAKIKQHGSILTAVSDEEMLAAAKELALSEGVFCQTESASVLAALVNLARAGLMARDSLAVLVITGSGLKTALAPEDGRFSLQDAPLERVEELLTHKTD